jgi:hypothetical protein
VWVVVWGLMSMRVSSRPQRVSQVAVVLKRVSGVPAKYLGSRISVGKILKVVS